MEPETVDIGSDLDSESYPLGKRIAVFGKGGKTTLARALADRFEFEFVELDAIRHMAGWVERPDDDFREVVTASLDGAQRGWVTDGNYLTVRLLIFDRVETVIVLALPWKIMLWRTFKRSLRRSYKREELWNGNREPLGNLVRWAPEDNIMRWAWVKYPHYCEKFAASRDDGSWDHAAVHRLRTPAEVDASIGLAIEQRR